MYCNYVNSSTLTTYYNFILFSNGQALWIGQVFLLILHVKNKDSQNVYKKLYLPAVTRQNISDRKFCGYQSCLQGENLIKEQINRQGRACVSYTKHQNSSFSNMNIA